MTDVLIEKFKTDYVYSHLINEINNLNILIESFKILFWNCLTIY